MLRPKNYNYFIMFSHGERHSCAPWCFSSSKKKGAGENEILMFFHPSSSEGSHTSLEVICGWFILVSMFTVSEKHTGNDSSSKNNFWCFSDPGSRGWSRDSSRNCPRKNLLEQCVPNRTSFWKTSPSNMSPSKNIFWEKVSSSCNENR